MSLSIYQSRLHNERRVYDIETITGLNRRQWLFREYITLQKSCDEISEDLAKIGIKITPRTLNRWLKRLEIKTRNGKESFNLAIKRGRIDYEHQRKQAKFSRKTLQPKLRYKILERDEFKCQKCGNTAKNGALLEVDHITPVSKGGKTEYNNLETLCWLCNKGKGEK